MQHRQIPGVCFSVRKLNTRPTDRLLCFPQLVTCPPLHDLTASDTFGGRINIISILLIKGLLLLFMALPSMVQAADITVGSIKLVKGNASIVRGGKTLPTGLGTRVLLNDTLRVGPGGAISMIFRDNSLLSVGPESEVRIDEFVFSPAEGKLSLVTRILKGTLAYISGVIGKLSPGSIRFETPVTTIATRGTTLAVKVTEPEHGTSRAFHPPTQNQDNPARSKEVLP